ncbi:MULTISPECIES: hypothetical protein [Hymenobacter]|uniref:STAS/SEC14 domain-containing protein n=1 Tax=Hymenobacter jejuensis TaxID=2502781 RepID=A0A5B7ZWM1_9BACT|nr:MULTISPECIES: hypothetical protein [Hymenobacter]MBC6988785.1 hypothetical protein [Hymenobacter sp. BT491]QDA58903.1 hypothetical protein FHG12_01765 [Hymenobacter jejuensis]
MAKRLLYETDSISIYYDYAEEWLHVDWHGPQDYDSVTTGAMQMLQCLKDEQCTKVLNDNTLVTTMWSDASVWGGEVWLPLMAEAGCQYFAWVYSPNIYSRLSTDLTLQHSNAGVIVLTFDDIATAGSWLRLM